MNNDLQILSNRSSYWREKEFYLKCIEIKFRHEMLRLTFELELFVSVAVKTVFDMNLYLIN